MFNCKACLEKNNHIESLKFDIEFLRGMLSPTQKNVFTEIRDLEANKILDGGGMPLIEIEDSRGERARERQKVEQEMDRILSGNY